MKLEALDNLKLNNILEINDSKHNQNVNVTGKCVAKYRFVQCGTFLFVTFPTRLYSRVLEYNLIGKKTRRNVPHFT